MIAISKKLSERTAHAVMALYKVHYKPGETSSAADAVDVIKPW